MHNTTEQREGGGDVIRKAASLLLLSSEYYSCLNVRDCPTKNAKGTIQERRSISIYRGPWTVTTHDACHKAHTRYTARFSFDPARPFNFPGKDRMRRVVTISGAPL